MITINLTHLIPILIYLLSIAIYLHPLTLAPTPSEPPSPLQKWNLITHPRPQLDELHIMSSENTDIHPPSSTSASTTTHSWKEAWYNDYWGRPLSSESSHKSWRPVSVWSFRFGKGGSESVRTLIGNFGRMVGGFVESLLQLFGAGYGTAGGADKENGDRIIASELFVHRVVNVFIHAAIVQIIGIIAALLFAGNQTNNSNNKQHSKQLQLYTKYTSQLLFALHPTHVEAVVNVANRPHILALLLNATICDPNVPLVGMALLGILGLLTAETAIFQLPAVVMTMTAIRYGEIRNVEMLWKSKEQRAASAKQKSQTLSSETENESDMRNEEEKTQQQQQPAIIKTCITLLPRYTLLTLISTLYLLYRKYYNDSLSIPEGLIRPAENPFYDKTQLDRIVNYSYILALHVMKSFGVELVGFSHEYGFDCIPQITSFGDKRLWLVVGMIVFFEGLFVWAWKGLGDNEYDGDGEDAVSSLKTEHTSGNSGNNSSRQQQTQQHEERVQRMLLALVFSSWMATLFPISGILKVGTFVADRIAIASTFGTCIFGGRFFALWIVGSNATSNNNITNNAKRKSRVSTPLKILLLIYLPYELARRTHSRAAEWMDSATLLESSLRACPKSIKSNLEMSKIYSGLVPHMLDLEKSLTLISTAQSIDPTYCDVHQQYAHVYFQQSKYIPFEEEMVQSLMCQFTMGQAMNNWNKYWKVVLHGGGAGGGKSLEDAKRRYDGYMKRIQEAIAESEREEEMKKRRRRTGGGDSSTKKVEL